MNQNERGEVTEELNFASTKNIKSNVSQSIRNDAAVTTLAVSRLLRSDDGQSNNFKYGDDEDDVICEIEYIPPWRGGDVNIVNGNTALTTTAAASKQSVMQPSESVINGASISVNKKDIEENEHLSQNCSFNPCYSQSAAEDVSPLAAICRQISSSPVDGFEEVSECASVDKNYGKFDKSYGSSDTKNSVTHLHTSGANACSTTMSGGSKSHLQEVGGGCSCDNTCMSCSSPTVIADKVKNFTEECIMAASVSYGGCSGGNMNVNTNVNTGGNSIVNTGEGYFHPGRYPCQPDDNIYEEVPFSKIYEDLSDFKSSADFESGGYGGVKLRQRSNTDSSLVTGNRKSLVEEVMFEVERVQRQHDQVLNELDLDVENMIMAPPSPRSPLTSDNNNNNNDMANDNANADDRHHSSPPQPRRGSSGTCSEYSRQPNHVRSFSLTSYPSRDLPSLPSRVDSSRVGSPRMFMKRDSLKLIQGAVTSTPVSKRKWIRLPSKTKDKTTAPDSLYSKEKYSKGTNSSLVDPLYMQYGGSDRQDNYYRGEYNADQSPYSSYSDDGIYEDIEQNLLGPRFRFQSSSLRHKETSEETEIFECGDGRYSMYGGGETEKNSVPVGLAKLKSKFRNATRRIKKMRDDGKAKEPEYGRRQGSILSWRRDYDLYKNREAVVENSPPINEVELNVVKLNVKPPLLPPMPSDLSPEQIKRRYIISTLVHSENTYVATLKRLIQDYKKPLEESHPPILSKAKIEVLFCSIREILQCHTMFRIALADCVKRWDKDEKIGDVFVASFSKSMVLEMYSEFINNFSSSMELAKLESKRKSAFSDFLKVKQITSHDRLSFFGLMVKPVQRFPQFILLLQDLLKHTPHDHHDRMSLQLALTQLESLAEMLNERKRESEQQHAVKELMRHVSAKFSSVKSSFSDGSHCLLRQDNATQLTFDQDGQILKAKERRLYLLNDVLVCVSSCSHENAGSEQRYSLKWAVPVTDVEILEEASPTLNRMITSPGRGKVSAGKSPDKSIGDCGNFQGVYLEMADLMHDFEVMSRISALVSTLKRSYPGLSCELTQRHSQMILRTVQDKDEEMKWMDNCCLQLWITSKSKGSKELVTFQMSGPAVTKEWTSELRLAQLALDVNNSPGWDIPEQERRPTTKLPLFVRALPVHSTSHPTEVKSVCSYTCVAKPPSSKHVSYLWVCCSDGINTRISILNVHHMARKEISSFDLAEVRISTMEAVPPESQLGRPAGLKGWTIWMGTDSRRILIYSGTDPEKHESLGYVSVSASVLQICCHAKKVYAALTNGKIFVFGRFPDGSWNLKDPYVVDLGSEPVTSLLPFDNSLYIACGRKVWLMDCTTREIMKSFTVQHEHLGNVYLLAQSGVGLWINIRNTATICLYHTETFRHLQDINVASNINRILAENVQMKSPRCIFVTSLLACRGLLWVGTNVGVILTIPLPRLEGVPIISGRATLSYHMLDGPVTTLATLNTHANNPLPVIPNQPPVKESTRVNQARLTKQLSLGLPHSPVKSVLRPQLSTPSLTTQQKGDSPLSPHPKSKGFQNDHVTYASSNDPGETDDDVYGLYGDLLNVRKYVDGSVNDVLYEPLRRSQPDLLPNAINTLDRRMKMKVGRPKSLDLTNLCSMHSDSVYVSSSSEGGSSSSSSVCVSCSSINEAPPPSGGNQSSATVSSTTAGFVGTAAATVPSAATKTSTLSRKSQIRSKLNGSSAETQRTVMTVVGGRGYRNLRQGKSNLRDHSSSARSKEAYILLWEAKL